MPRIIIETSISASPETCFDLMRDARIHTGTISTNGKLTLGQMVTFESRHLGMRQRFTVKVVEFDRPRLFVDEMIEGGLRSFTHVHEFREKDKRTIMVDTLEWTSPFGILGMIVDEILLKRRLQSLVSKRNARLKDLADASAHPDR